MKKCWVGKNPSAQEVADKINILVGGGCRITAAEVSVDGLIIYAKIPEPPIESRQATTGEVLEHLHSVPPPAEEELTVEEIDRRGEELYRMATTRFGISRLD